MTSTRPDFGVFAAMATPFDEAGAVDHARAADHAVRLLAEGCDGLALFGTTGEGASLGERERGALHDALLAAGAPAERIVVALVAPALETAIAQAEAALERGANRLLATPPFYFKGVSDEALYAWHARLIEAVGGRGARLVLYHIPAVTGVPLSRALVRRLKRAFGEAILGVKDSDGEIAYAEALCADGDLAVLVGDERLLARAARAGAAGTISGLANVVPGRLGAMLRTGADDAELVALVEAVTDLPVVPAVKALVAERRADDGWRRARPPLEGLAPEAARRLAAHARPLLGADRGR
ncbi:dihydrodipicolinate synthase family protein [Salinarimonas sp.]|uniref:dihydrodipicolinate synthase family protein n=1 Tax=Salinarimonas sp. TaxID=2766526 RepID=UPI0032D93FB6